MNLETETRQVNAKKKKKRKRKTIQINKLLSNAIQDIRIFLKVLILFFPPK
jgi:hypothetical protein